MRLALLLVVIVVLVYVYLMQFVDHKQSWIPYFVIFLALIKTSYFTSFTFSQVNKSIKQCHSFGQLYGFSGYSSCLIIFSYAAYFACLPAVNTSFSFGIKPLASFNYLEYLSKHFISVW